MKYQRRIQILDYRDRKFVGEFFAKRPQIDTNEFLRRAVLLAINAELDNDLERVINKIIENQRKYGGQEI
jgi:hypothetical protein